MVLGGTVEVGGTSDVVSGGGFEIDVEGEVEATGLEAGAVLHASSGRHNNRKQNAKAHDRIFLIDAPPV